MSLTSDVTIDATKFHPSNVDAGTEKILQIMQSTTEGAPKWYDVGAAKYREMISSGKTQFPAPPVDPKAQDSTIPSRDSDRYIPIRFYKPDNGQPSQGVYVFFHGGGFAFSSHLEQDTMLKGFANSYQLTAVSVGYRLAPEEAWPAGIHDCIDVSEYLVDHQDMFGAPLRVLGGESAGGNFAVLTTFQLIRSCPKHRLDAVLLINGIYDLTLNLPSTVVEAPSGVIDRTMLEKFMDVYIPGISIEARRNPLISPLYDNIPKLVRESPFNSLPPALFLVGTADPLVDDSLLMSLKWMASGSEARISLYPGAPHMFGAFAGFKVADDAAATMANFLKEKLRNGLPSELAPGFIESITASDSSPLSRKVKCLLPNPDEIGPLGIPQMAEKSCERCRSFNMECIVERTILGRPAAKRARRNFSPVGNTAILMKPGIKVHESAIAPSILNIEQYIYSDLADDKFISRQDYRLNLSKTPGKQDIFQSMVEPASFLSSIVANDQAFGCTITHATSRWNTALPDLISKDLAVSLNKCIQLAVSTHGQEFVHSPPTHRDSVIVSLLLSDYKPTALVSWQSISHRTIKSGLYVDLAYRIAERLELLPTQVRFELSELQAMESSKLEDYLTDSLQGLQLCCSDAFLGGFALKPLRAMQHVLGRMKPHIDMYPKLLEYRQCSPKIIYHVQYMTATYIMMESLTRMRQGWNKLDTLSLVIEEAEEACLEQLEPSKSFFANSSNCGRQVEVSAIHTLLEMRFHSVFASICGGGLFYAMMSRARLTEGDTGREHEIDCHEAIQVGTQVIESLRDIPCGGTLNISTFLDRFGAPYPAQLQASLTKFIQCAESLRLDDVAFYPPPRYLVLDIVFTCKNMVENNVIHLKGFSRLRPDFDQHLELFAKCAQKFEAMTTSPLKSIDAAFAGGCLYAAGSKAIHGLCDLMERLKERVSRGEDRQERSSILKAPKDPNVSNMLGLELPSEALDMWPYPEGSDLFATLQDQSDWSLALSLFPELDEQCDALIQAGLGNRLLFATDPDYEPRIASWWALNARLHPWCLFQPQDTAEVSASMTALLGAGDGAGDWHIAVRAGGHNTGRTNNVDNGVTIDLGNMNRTTYNSQSNLASMGPGAKWKDAYAELRKYGVLVPGGRDGGVGVGGFLLGGGLTYYVGREAFACDSVKNFEIVLTNGTVVNANRDQNPDLWMALKGGGSNFGIVTRYDMEALPDKELAYGTRIMSANYSSALVDAVVYFTDHNQEFDTDALVAYLSHDTSIIASDVIAVAIHVNTEGVHNTTGFAKLNQIPSLVPDNTLSVSLAQAAEDSQLPSGTWNAGATITFKNDKRILTRAVQLHDQYVQDLKHALGADNFETYVFFQPLPTFFGQLSKQKGGNMLGIDLQEYNAIMWTGGVAVNTSQQDLAFAQTRLNAMVAELKSFSVSLAGGNRLVYLNYADSSQDPLGSYVKENVEHIRNVAAKYDPKGAFQKRFPGGFKISRRTVEKHMVCVSRDDSLIGWPADDAGVAVGTGVEDERLVGLAAAEETALNFGGPPNVVYGADTVVDAVTWELVTFKVTSVGDGSRLTKLAALLGRLAEEAKLMLLKR
ncbi:MAG: hypothetical protein Q9165_007914 [Trypethelium subeluteriae]